MSTNDARTGSQLTAAGAGALTSVTPDAAGQHDLHQHEQRQRVAEDVSSGGSEVMDSEMLDAQLSAAAVQVCGS